MLQQIRRVAQRATLYAIIRQELFADAMQQAAGADSDNNFDVDFTAERITFHGGAVQARCRPLASIAVDPATLLWAHSQLMSSQMGGPGAADKVLEFGRQHNLDELTQDEVEYGTPDSPGQQDQIVALGHDVGQLGVEIHGPHTTYYTFKTGSAGSRMACLVEDHSVDIPPVTLQDVLVRLPRLSTGVDDLAWSLGGLADKLNWRLDARDTGRPDVDNFRLTDTQGASIIIESTRDQYGRITQIRLDGVHQPS